MHKHIADKISRRTPYFLTANLRYFVLYSEELSPPNHRAVLSTASARAFSDRCSDSHQEVATQSPARKKHAYATPNRFRVGKASPVVNSTENANPVLVALNGRVDNSKLHPLSRGDNLTVAHGTFPYCTYLSRALPRHFATSQLCVALVVHSVTGCDRSSGEAGPTIPASAAATPARGR